MPRPIHRNFYRNVSPDGVVPRGVPIIHAHDVVDSDGVHLHFHDLPKAFTPSELRNAARWFYALAREAESLAVNGLVSKDHGYDVVKGRQVPKLVDPTHR